MNDESYSEPVPDETLTQPAVVLPEETALPPTPPPAAPRRGLTRLAWAALALALILVGVGAFFLGRWVGGDESAAPSTTTTMAALFPAGDTLPPGDEPVAAVAAALSPSVVQIESRIGLGSGVIYRDGYIITAAHVVTGVERVTVRLADGSELDGTVVGTDANSDVAVVQADGADLPAAAMGLGVEVETGQMAIAIGSPWGLEGSVTAGVISTVRRTVTGQDGLPRTMIQTDTSINPGNSGGALADRQGRVIGINDAIFSTSGGSEGVGFAIPIDNAVYVADRLIGGEEIRPAFLGVVGEDPTSGEAGALIAEVVADSPAEAAGFQAGDLIVAVDDQPIQSYTDLVAVIRGSQPGTEVTITLQRDGRETQIAVTLAERPAD